MSPVPRLRISRPSTDRLYVEWDSVSVMHAVRTNCAVERGAEPVEISAAAMELKLAAVRGIGGALIYFVDRYASAANPHALSIYDVDFEYLPGVDRYTPGSRPEADRSFDS